MRDRNKYSRRNRQAGQQGEGILTELLKAIGPEAVKLIGPLLKKPAEEVGQFLSGKLKDLLGNGSTLAGQGSRLAGEGFILAGPQHTRCVAPKPPRTATNKKKK